MAASFLTAEEYLKFLKFTSGLLVNKMNKWLLLSVAMFVMAAMALVLPLCVDITVMSTALALMGLAMGLFDAGKFQRLFIPDIIRHTFFWFLFSKTMMHVIN